MNANVWAYYRQQFLGSIANTTPREGEVKKRSYWGTFFKPVISSVGAIGLFAAIGLGGWALWVTGSVMVGLSVLVSWGIVAAFVMYLPNLIEYGMAALRATWDMTKGSAAMEKRLETRNETVSD